MTTAPRISADKLTVLKQAIQVNTKQQAADLERIMAPKESGLVHGPLVQQADDSPWGNSPEWQELAEDYRTKQKVAVETPASSPDHAEASLAASKAHTAMKDMQAELRESAMAAGTWVIQDETAIAVKDSIADKAAALIDKVNG